MITLLRSGINILWGSHENLHFGNESDMHIRSDNYEESGYYGLGLDLLTITDESRVLKFLYEKWASRKMQPFETHVPLE